MSYILSILFISMGFIKQNSKIIAFLLFALLWVMFGWSSGNADYANYERGYSWAHGALRFNTELGTQLLYKLFILAGLEYRHYIIIISLIGLLLIFKTIKTYTNNIAFVLALYFLFPFIIDVVQARNFLTMSIVLYATHYLIQEKRRGTLKFVILVLLASTIHYSALFYLLFLLVKKRSLRSLTLLSLLVTSIGLILSYTNLIPLLVKQFIPPEKVHHWFSNRFNWGILIAILIYAFSYFFIYYAYLKIKSKTETEGQLAVNDTSNNNLRFARAVYKINMVLLMAFPLYVFNMIFFRLYRNILILNFILYAICLYNLEPKSKEKLLFGFCIVLFTVCLSIYFTMYSFYDTVFLPLFQNNILLGK